MLRASVLSAPIEPKSGQHQSVYQKAQDNMHTE